jgi:hypothetical protein
VTCDDLRRDAAGLAAMRPGHPERDAAFLHARDCPGCQEALRKGAALIALLDALPAPEAPPKAVLARVAAAIAAETRRARALTGRAAGVAAGVAWVAFLLFARHHETAAPVWIGAVVVGLAALAVAIAGPRLGGWVAAATVGASTLFALVAGTGRELEPAAGLHCFVSELLAGTAAFGAAMWMRRRHGEAETPWSFAAVAAAGALAGQAALNVVCGARDALPHLLVFHTGGVLVAAALGAAIGSARWVRGIG